MAKRITLAPGVYQDAHGITARVSKGTGPDKLSEEERYPLDTPLDDIKTWQAEARVRLNKLAAAGAVAKGTLDDDVRRYFKLVCPDREQASPANKITIRTADQREQQFTWWCEQQDEHGRRLGSRRRHGMHHTTLATVWTHLQGPASTRNSYRTAMTHLWKILDGKNAPNPWRDIPADPPDEPLPRGASMDVVRLIVAQLTTRFGPKDKKQNQARVKVYAATPLEPADMKRLRRESDDLDLDCRLGPVPSVFMHARKKGKGAPAQRVPLTPAGVAAFREFVAANAFGPFSTSSMRKTFLAARKKAERILQQTDPTATLAGLRMKDFRHSFGTMMYQVSGSISTTGQLLRHRREATTRRYTQKAVPEHLVRANEAASAYLASLAPPPVAATGEAAPAKARRGLRRVK